MRIISFPYIEDENGAIVYPDDKLLFEDTQYARSLGIVYGKYHGDDQSIQDFDPSVLPIPIGLRTVYTMTEFLNKVPRIIRQQIRSEELAGTPEVLDWMFIVSTMKEVDLNNLPVGFVVGLEDMAVNPNITLTIRQVDIFLERPWTT